MNLFNVYSKIPIELTHGIGPYIFDKNGKKYLDFYGGHAVISIGHSHPYYIKKIKHQIDRICFYSNTINIAQQEQLAELLGIMSNYQDYNLFLCNSGAEAVENALKLSSFQTKKDKIIAFIGSFHGRTSGALAITDNKKIITKFNNKHNVIFLNYGDLDKLEDEMKKGDVCAIITEGIQGVSGIIDPGSNFFNQASMLCKKYQILFIIDEIQSGYGRTGHFFAHQYFHKSIQPDLITIAKGMGNGFPIAGVLIHPKFAPFYGMLGTTFGGNYLACTAGIAVLEIIKKDNLVQNASKLGQLLIKKLSTISNIKEIRGRGLMLGLSFNFPILKLQNILIKNYNTFVGISSDPYILRLLPPLNITPIEVDLFIINLKMALEDLKYEKEKCKINS